MKTIIKYLSEAHYLFAVLALIFGVIFIKIVPPFWGIDETSHFARVYQLAHGDITTDKTQAHYGGTVPSNLLDLINYSKGDLLDNKSIGFVSRKDVDSVKVYKQLTAKKFTNQQKQLSYMEHYNYYSLLSTSSRIQISYTQR